MTEKPQLETIFGRAIEIENADKRDDYLEQACGNDSILREQLDQLVRDHFRAGGFLEQPLAQLDAESISSSPADALIGERIGAYVIRQQIGEGGMGVVYVAEQAEPVQRKVALKIIRPGMASKEVVARFEVERQALAMMDHPNIARVFDGGTTAAGQPYFVMELVQGPPITKFCDQQRLSNPDRLKLFATVCRAVEHAHQRGIIHRDLKPSNVLVPKIDGAPVTKVIDFGVAKAIGQKLANQTLYTQLAQMIGTPLYMSPEQVDLGVVDVDTRSDVYALGVLLYELLTGSTPYSGDTLRQVGYDEMRRIICEDSPRRPSTMVNTLADEALSTVSERRRSDPRTLSSSLKGELDWLVMKALEKDRNRRYQSAAALADDVQRYLDDEPIVARPPSTTYHIRKFVRRNRALVASMVTIIVALTAGLALATAGFVAAQRQLAEVTKEQENNRELIKLLGDFYPNPWGMKTLGRNHTVYEAIETMSPTLETRLKDHPVVQVEVRRIFADAYFAAGEYTKAREHLEKALDIAEELYDGPHETVADIHALLADEVGWNYDVPHDYANKLEHAQRAIEMYEALGIESSPQLGAAWFAKGHCLLLTSPERQEEAEQAQRKCVEVHTRIGDIPVIAMWDLGLMLMDFGDERLDDAATVMRTALSSYEEGKHHAMDRATALSGLASCLRHQGDIAGSLNYFTQSWELFQVNNELQNEPRGFRVGMLLVETLFANGDLDEAFRQLSQLEAKVTQEWAPVESLVDFHFLRGWLHFQLEDDKAAEESFRTSIELAEHHLGEDHLMVGVARGYLAMALERLERDDEAVTTFQRVLPIVKPYVELPYVRDWPYWTYARAVLGSTGDAKDVADPLDACNRAIMFLDAWNRTWLEPGFHHVIAGLHIHRGDRQAAVKSLTTGLEKAVEPQATWRSSHKGSPPPHPGAPTTRRDLELMLAGLYVNDGQAEDARRVLHDAVLERMKLGENHIQVALAQLRLGEFLVNQSDFAGAESTLRSAVDKLEPHPNVVEHLRRRAAAGLAKVDQATGRSVQSAE